MSNNPVWTRSASIEDYGGHQLKTNYMGQGVINALTDIGAEHINRAAADLVCAGRTAPFLVARLTCDDTTPAAPTVHWCSFMPAGESNVDFVGSSPPTGFPAFSRTGDGVIRVTFDAEYEDAYGNTAPTVLRLPKGSGGGSVYANVVGSLISTLIAEFSVFNSSGTALTNQTIAIQVY